MPSRLVFWGSVGLGVYTYVGYPVALVTLSRFRRFRGAGTVPAAGALLPSVALLIAAHNEESVIGEKLEQSLALDYPVDKLKIVVATDGSDDNTVKIVERYAERRVVLSHADIRNGKTAAIARAMRLIDSEIIVFSDANNRYEAETVRELVAAFSDPSVGAVTGAKVVVGESGVGTSEGIYWKYESFIKRQETLLGCCTSTAGEVLAIRRSLWEEPPAGIINDDFWIAARIIRRGWRVVYEPRARSIELASDSAQSERVRRTRIVAGRYQALTLARQLVPRNRPLVAWQMISHKFLRPLVPFAMIGAMAANLAAMRTGPALVPMGGKGSTRALLAIQILFYATALLGNRMPGPAIVRKLTYVPRFLVESNVAALIGLARHLRSGQSASWERPRRGRNIFDQLETASTHPPSGS